MTNETRKRLPPYISYRTFENFIERLQQQVPSRIDRSYWGETLSGSTGTQLMAALHFLDLIDANGRPTDQLKLVSASHGEQRTHALKEITWEAYDFVLKSPLDLQNATYSQLEEVFHGNFQLTNDVCRKCIKFFISIATSSGTTLSPFVTKRVRWTHSTSGTGTTKIVQRKVTQQPARNPIVPNWAQIPLAASNDSWPALLLAKFPAFDPTWNEDVQSKWFSAFDELLQHFRPKV